jgi:RES domain
VTQKPTDLPALWRVGYYADPLGFTPLDLYSFNHRFDDIHRRFRTLYCAELPETCLREVLADFRPNLGAMRRHVERYGPSASQDFTPAPVTARWRAQHVLVPVVLRLDGPLIDLTDVPTRQKIEERHVELLVEHGLEHLDLHEITISRRAITQTIAADLFDRGAGAVRFPSRLDGNACIALFEGRGTADPAGDPIALTDPPPEPLTNVTAPWGVVLEPAPATVSER